MEDPSDQNTGIVLSSAGAYGAYELGVLKALFEGVPWTSRLELPDFSTIVGASGGAVNAALLVSNGERDTSQALQHIEEVWLDRIAEGSNTDGNGVYRIRGVPKVLDVRCLAKPANLIGDLYSDGVFFLRNAIRRGSEILGSEQAFKVLLIESGDLSALFNTDRFANLVDEVISFESIRSSQIALRIIATDLDEGNRRIFDNRDVSRFRAKSVLASAAIPGIFAPIEIDDHLYAAEGTLMDIPILPTAKGADTLHVIYMDPDISEAPDFLDTTIGALDFLFAANWAAAMNREIDEIGKLNKGLSLVNRTGTTHDEGIGISRARELIKGSGIHQHTTIHRYRLRENAHDLLGFLDFSRSHIERLIERGYSDTIEHDCAVSGCLLAEEDNHL